MSACPLPTDSVLRRHFEQLASTVGLSAPPQDSVQLRHYRQLLDARLAQATPPAPAPRVTTAAPPRPAEPPRPATASAAAPRAPQPQPAATPRPAAPPAQTQRKGWFASLLDRLLGR